MLVTGFCTVRWPRRSSRLSSRWPSGEFAIRWQSRFPPAQLPRPPADVLGLYVLSLTGSSSRGDRPLLWSGPLGESRDLLGGDRGRRRRPPRRSPRSIDRLAAAAGAAGSAFVIDLALRQVPSGASPRRDRFHIGLSRDVTFALRPHGRSRSETRRRDRQLPLGRIPLRPLRRGRFSPTELYRDLDRGQKLNLANYFDPRREDDPQAPGAAPRARGGVSSWCLPVTGASSGGIETAVPRAAPSAHVLLAGVRPPMVTPGDSLAQSASLGA